jgi:alkyl sulfatase BDS1-like metallo-beta-lactamase superfamily hydrolase
MPDNKAVGLHVRRGVIEYTDNADRYYRKPDFTLSLTREAWTKLHLNQATVAQLAGAGELKVIGDAAACDRVLDLFDRFDAA